MVGSSDHDMLDLRTYRSHQLREVLALAQELAGLVAANGDNCRAADLRAAQQRAEALHFVRCELQAFVAERRCHGPKIEQSADRAPPLITSSGSPASRGQCTIDQFGNQMPAGGVAGNEDAVGVQSVLAAMAMNIGDGAPARVDNAGHAQGGNSEDSDYHQRHAEWHEAACEETELLSLHRNPEAAVDEDYHRGRPTC